MGEQDFSIAEIVLVVEAVLREGLGASDCARRLVPERDEIDLELMDRAIGRYRSRARLEKEPAAGDASLERAELLMCAGYAVLLVDEGRGGGSLECWDEAARRFEALEAWERCAEALEELLESLGEAHEWQAAAEVCRRRVRALEAMEAWPRAAQAMATLGSCLRRSGRHAEALEVHLQVMERFAKLKSSPEALARERMGVADALRKLGRGEEAVGIYRDVLQTLEQMPQCGWIGWPRRELEATLQEQDEEHQGATREGELAVHESSEV